MTNPFDRFADSVAEHVAHPWFFAFCLGLVVGWIGGLPFVGPSNQLYHLVLNSPTTAITFLLVALLHNGQHRFERAVNQRLQCLIDAVENLEDPVEDEGQKPTADEQDETSDAP